MEGLSLYKGVEDLPRGHYIYGAEKRLGEGISTKTGVIATSDTTSPLVVQGMEDTVIPLFVRNFPLWAIFRKVPANGLSHTWAQWNAFSNNTFPTTISETGFINDDSNSYNRRTTNIAVFATRRTLPLKASLAGAAAGGVSSDLMGRELNGGLLTLARDGQNEMLRFQTTYNDAAHGGTGASGAQIAAAYQNPDGWYDPNGFNGLRYIANNETPPENTILVDISGGAWTDQRVLKGVHNAVNYLWDKGGRADCIVTGSAGSTALFADQFSLVRYDKQANSEIVPGFRVRTVDTDQGPLPVMLIPGNSLGTYVINDGGGNPHLYQDLYILDSEQFEIPYLGNPEPSIIRIPTAVNGQLVEASVLYAMYGLAALAPSISLARVQIKLT
jgi:hypothetical protein